MSKPECLVHHKRMRWAGQYRAWICMVGVRDRTCKGFFNLPGPERPRRHFHSYMTWDGREILSPADWDRRRYEVWIRDGKRCQVPKMTAPGQFEICGKYLPWLADMDLDHIVRRGSGLHGRDDRMQNLRAACKKCNRRRRLPGLAFSGGLGMTLYAPIPDSEERIPNADVCAEVSA